MNGSLFSLNVIFVALKNENEKAYNDTVFFIGYCFFC